MAVQVGYKSSKVNYYGIEVDPEITWETWEPGKKYTKKLTLKNVKYSTQKLNFCVPAKEVFTTTFPKTITLSAGTSFFLPITFKPHKREVFIDKIDFKNTDGDLFSVPVRALLPKFEVEFNSKLSCGTVAAHDMADECIEVRNVSELETPFRWNVEAPYSIEPLSGTLEPFSSAIFKVSFKPQDVGTYSMAIPFLFGTKLMHQKMLTVTSVAKYPNISLLIDHVSQFDVLNVGTQILVEFNEGAVGKIYEKVLTVQNMSEVNASIELVRDDDTNPIDWVFFPSIEFSRIPAQSCVDIPIQFRPKLVLTKYVENFLIRISNKCGTLSLKCQAQTEKPSVTVDHSSVNFFQLNPKEVITKSVRLHNANKLAISFQFVIDPESSVFHVDKCCGIIKSFSDVQILITFRPQNPIQYYRRIVCLIPDQDPIFIDLLGTCHDINCRPHILQLSHLVKFQRRQTEGLSYHSPENLLRYLTKKELMLNEDGDLKIQNEEAMKDLIDLVPSLSNWKEYFFAHGDSDVVMFTPYLGQDVHVVYFNGVEYMEKSKIQSSILSGEMDVSDAESINCFQRTVAIKNNTKSPLILQWTVLANANQPSIFTINPTVAELSSNETVNFCVTFAPNGADRMFGAELEGFAYFKSQRQFELVDENLISPPFCILLKCLGHTFIGNHEPFLPRHKFDKYEIVFPSVNTEEMAFTSFTLFNKSDQPLIYDCPQLKDPFSVNPKVGYILPRQLQIFTMLSEPKCINKYEEKIQMKLNDRNDYVEHIPILGSADNAELQMSNKSELYFPPTNLGNISVQSYPIKNKSRIPLLFQWKIRPDDSFKFRVYPQSGHILPNEISSQKWVFHPTDVGRNCVKVLLMVQGRSPFGSLTEPKYYPLRIIGDGENATIEVVGSTEINFPSMVVGSSAVGNFKIYNPSEATLFYKLFAKQSKTADDGTEEEQETIDCIEITNSKGILTGRSEKSISILVRPKQRGKYQFSIGYSLVDNDHVEMKLKDANNEPDIANRILSMEENLLSAKVEGVFPNLRVTDIQGTGSSLWISKLNLWTNFSIDNLNVCLDSDPTTSELIYNVATRASFHRHTPVATRAVINANMGAAPLNADSSEVWLMFENCGTVPSQFSFLFPEDLELDLEYWAETGEYTDEELHQMKVQDNNLFSIEPRSGFITPGESISVLVKYNHIVVGTDRLPVLFKLDNGREILINLVGVTLDLSRAYVHFPSNKHLFSPVAIGACKTPAIQYYEMHNAGAIPVHFELDLAPLKALGDENFGIPILQCLNSIGDILPGQTCRLEWIFSPVEARTYTVNIPIHLSSGECPTVQFTAVAYDQRFLGDSCRPSGDTVGQSGVPSIQSIRVPGQLAQLNYERINVGTVPTFCTLHYVVFLNNIAPDNQGVTFSWNVTCSDDAEYVFMSPQNGRLLPRESATCHLTLNTRSIPRYFNINLICEIYNEAEIIKFRDDLLAWEQEESRQKVEFTITDKVQSEKKNALSKEKTRKQSNNSFLPPVLASPTKTRQQKSFSTTNTSLGQNGAGDVIWYKPQMPKPFFLNFGISGKSVAVDEFHSTEFQQKGASKFSINKIAMLEHMSSPVILNKCDYPIKGHQKEEYILDSVLADLVGSVIHDSNFLEAVQSINDEPVPYYVQFPGVSVKNDDKMPITSSLKEEFSDKQTLSNRTEESDKEKMMIKEKDEMTVVAKSPEVAAPSKPTSPTEEGSGNLNEQVILESLPFGTMVEQILENMLVNIVAEGNNREVDLTARPRLIALPPRCAPTIASASNLPTV